MTCWIVFEPILTPIDTNRTQICFAVYAHSYTRPGLDDDDLPGRWHSKSIKLSR